MVRFMILLIVFSQVFLSGTGNLRGEEGEAPAVKRAPLDLSHWARIPVRKAGKSKMGSDIGRTMPLDSFARETVEIICGRANPTLQLKGAIPDDEIDLSDYALAKELFPDGKPRKFKAAELLLSWLAEPEKWDEVPFLLAEHQTLREEYLKVPFKNEDGEHLKYVSPRQVRESTGFYKYLLDQETQSRTARMQEKEPTVVDDIGASKLYEAYRLYSLISSRPQRVATRPQITYDRVLDRRWLDKSMTLLSTWDSLQTNLPALASGEVTEGSVQAVYHKLLASMQKLAVLTEEANVKLADAEELAAGIVGDVDEMAVHLENLHARSREMPESLSSPDHPNAAQIKSARQAVREGAFLGKKLVQQAQEMHLALYEEGDALRLVPALNPFALERDRPMDDDAKPWLAMNTILYGSPALLSMYPQDELLDARAALNEVLQGYRLWDQNPTPENSQALTLATSTLPEKLRTLAETIEPIRVKLPVQDMDQDALAETAYPPAGETSIEVIYNTMDPFKWAWVINLLATVCFILSSMKGTRGYFFWTGVLVLIGAAAWSVFGFYLRVNITHFAPVTNMYETVIFVPLVASLLGLWLALLPSIWSGMKVAWRMTACPYSWEATPLTGEQEAIVSRGTWNWIVWLGASLRVALMAAVFWGLTQAGYAADHRQVIPLSPGVEGSASVGDQFNDLVTWGVGICVLIAAMWILPRVVATLILSVVAIPFANRGKWLARLNTVYPRWPYAAGAAGVAFFCSLVAWYSPILSKGFDPLQPVLRDNFWLTIHVLVIVSSYAAGALAWGLGNIALCYYLFGSYRKAQDLATARPELEQFKSTFGGKGRSGSAVYDSDSEVDDAVVGKSPPQASVTLSGYVYKATQVAVLLLFTGTILGALWADKAWGRFWGWDPKEVWALISGLVYIAILHGRFAGWFGNFGLVVGTVLGASAILFSWYGVNFVLGAGLHSYGFGTGGQLQVGLFVLANWIFLGAASVRYKLETSSRVVAHAEAVAT